jgi:hypothetical protein
MAKNITITTVLTDKGKQKLEDAKKIIFYGLAKSLRYSVDHIARKKIRDLAPDAPTEKEILCIGTDDMGSTRGSPPNKNSFFKDGKFKYLVQAIDEERSVIEAEENTVYAKFGNAKRLNSVIGFRWLTQVGPKNLQSRTTDDLEAGGAWSELIWAWENGSGQAAKFTVVRREAGARLNVDKDRSYLPLSMEKSVPGFDMFKDGMLSSLKEMNDHIVGYLHDKLVSVRK